MAYSCRKLGKNIVFVFYLVFYRNTPPYVYDCSAVDPDVYCIAENYI